MERKKIKIAFDLDGVIIDKPPFVPKWLIEWLFRGGTESIFSCRYPTCKLDQWIRKLSHYYLFRPPINENLVFLHKINKDKRFEFYIISSRYLFLKKETEDWFSKRKLNGLFKKIYLNKDDLKPYLFKEIILKEVKPDFFIDDDREVIDYLKKRLSEIKFIFFDGKTPLEELLNFE